MLINFYNIWYALYWVNLQCSNHWLVHLTYILLLHYLVKEVGCRNYNFTKQVNFLLLYRLIKHPVYPHNQSALNPKYYSKCSKCPPFSCTQAWSLLRHSSTTSSESVNHQALSQIGHVPNWYLMHTIQHYAPYSIVNWIKIKAIGRP